MKFVANGGLIVGTVDGANIEIGQEAGPDNIFLFGALSSEVNDIKHKQTYCGGVQINSDLKKVTESIKAGNYGHSTIFEPLIGKKF
jgi:starch phosphorylase